MRKSILVISFEACRGGSAPEKHINGTLGRLKAAQFPVVKSVVVSDDRHTVLRWASVLWRAVVQLPRARAIVLRFHPVSLPLLLLSRVFRVRTVGLVQGVADDAFSTHSWLKRVGLIYSSLVRWELSLLDASAAPTSGISKWVQERTGKHCFLLPNGVDNPTPRYGAVAGSLPARYACFSGSLATWQGVEVMVEATHSPYWPTDLPLVVVGDGKLLPYLKSASSPKIIVTGRLGAEYAQGVLSGAIVSLSPKIICAATAHGVSPFKVLESCALGVPVVVSRIDGQWEAIESFGAGKVVSPGDPDELAKAVAEISASRVLRSKMASGASRLAGESQWDVGAPALSALIG